MIGFLLVKAFPLIFSIATLIVITIGTFFSVHSFGYIDYDDPAYITANPYVNSGLDAQNIQWAFTYKESKGPLSHVGVDNLYHPITWLSHMLDVQVFGIQSPGAQHLVNLSIHLLAGILLFFIFLKLLKNHLIAFVTACLFCIHPLHVESVAWLSERKDTLSALFAFASILCYQCYAEKQNKNGKWLSVVFFTLALLSKPSVVILPGILILLDQYQQHKMNKWDLMFLKHQLLSKLPWIIPSIVLGLATIYFQQGGSHSYFMKDISFWDRVVQMPTRLCYYFYQTFNPTSLSFHYAHPPYSTLLLSVGCLIGLLALTVFCYRIRERFPLALFGLVWFYVCILPMSGIVHVGTSFIADRYTYLAIIGIFACIVAALLKYFPKQYIYPVLAIMVLSCAWLAHQQTKVWKDSYALFTNAIEAQPRDAVGYVNLGSTYKVDGYFDEARHYYTKATELSPKNYIAYHNLAHIDLKQKQWNDAEANFLKALEGYEYYHPSLKSLSKLYRTVPEMHDLDKALIYTARYNKVVREREPQMLGIEIELLLNFNRIDEAKSKAEKLLRLPNLTPEAKQFINGILQLDSSS